MLKRISLAGILALSINSTAHAGTTESEWSKYGKQWGTAKVHAIKIRTACINAEDSAAHLVLKSYGNGVAVYGCNRGGF